LPDFLSGLFAAGALYPLWKQGLLAAPFKGWAAFIPLFLVFYLAAVLANIGLGSNGWTLTKLPIVSLTILLLVLVNINRTKYAGLALLVLIFIASINLITTSKVMGFPGFAFVIFTTAGILFVFDERRILKQIFGTGEN